MRDRSTGWPAADLTRQQGEKRRDATELSVYPKRTHPREVIEAALAHVVGDRVEAAYACSKSSKAGQELLTSSREI